MYSFVPGLENAKKGSDHEHRVLQGSRRIILVTVRASRIRGSIFHSRLYRVEIFVVNFGYSLAEAPFSHRSANRRRRRRRRLVFSTATRRG